MLAVYTGRHIREAEEPLLEAGAGPALMRTAAWGLAQGVIDVVRAQNLPFYGTSVTALIGTGNNGGDGLWALSFLAKRGFHVSAVQMGDRVHPEGALAFERSGGRWVSTTDASYLAADVLIDAVLGTGARGAWQPPPLPDLALTVACDVPSGVNADNGTVQGASIEADLTVTFGGLKAGLLIGEGANYSGDVKVIDIGLGPHLPTPRAHLLEPEDLPNLLPPQENTNHKYTRGVLGVLAGSTQYPGAASLACAAALATGVGMIRFVREHDNDELGRAVVAAHPEVVLAESTQVRVQGWLLGSGLGEEETRRAQTQQVLTEANEHALPIVVDANALELIGAHDAGAQHRILTPHAGEAAALLERLGHKVLREQVEADPLQAAELLANNTGSTVVLKGPQTVITDGQSTVIYPGGHPFLATAGTGDTLAGICAAVATGWAEHQNPPSLVLQAAAAVWVHGAASYRAAQTGPFGASALAAEVRRVLAELH